MNVKGIKLEEARPGVFNVMAGDKIVGSVWKRGQVFWAAAYGMKSFENGFESKADAAEAVVLHLVTQAACPHHGVVRLSPQRVAVIEQDAVDPLRFKVVTKAMPRTGNVGQVLEDLECKEPRDYSELTNSVIIEEDDS